MYYRDYIIFILSFTVPRYDLSHQDRWISGSRDSWEQSEYKKKLQSRSLTVDFSLKYN